MSDLSRQMRIISALLAQADDPSTTPEESQTFREKADALMFQYKIQTLIAPVGKGVERPGPEWTTVFVARAASDWSGYYNGIASAILNHNECRHIAKYERNEEDGHLWLAYEVVGLPSDIAYAQALVTQAILEFGKRLEPQVIPGEEFGAACLRMRQGGMERKRIAMLLLGTWTTENEMKAKNRKVSNAIKSEAARIGQPELADELLGRTTNIKTYRKSYASAFYVTLLSRIQVRRSAEQMEAHGLVLASAKDAVDEAFYERYPDRRPKATVESSAPKQASCEKCSKAASGYCREHQWMKPRASRYSSPYSSAGARAGSHAARNVDLGSTGTGKVGPGSGRSALEG